MPAFKTIEVASFQALQSEVERIRRGSSAIFRGYSAKKEEESPKALVTGLQRVCIEIDGNLGLAKNRETAIIREFRRRAYHYVTDLPELEHYFEWLALMQHHGAPTRLLDCTYSLHVAVHFALSHTSRTESANLAIWMVNDQWCQSESAKLCGNHAANLRAVPLHYDREPRASSELLGSLPVSVWPINPFRLNERLTLQRGVFLAPASVTETFASNLQALPGYGDESNVVQFILPRSEGANLSKQLYDTNVTETTLFPGLDGFARSLWQSARHMSLENLHGLENI